ncbi:hypothetical protein U0X36_04905 [Bacillus thuringiensis]|uniref:phosphatidylinositol-specific phospholipase C domain-containing protein n=1 Tax=Bacillus thuringiensis TaxID=1428 RepID=UPI00115DB7A1|nr:phosphatidylinositol-specific phospholipase C domain-containing protein [Bacillus thuringiensis]MDZ3952292.1 hypothetical protein [Bacillus thuringiensis]
MKNEIKISQLSIPGTRGSMALHGETSFDENLTRNQRMNLATQLQAGVRYFDMRCRHIGDSFSMHHGPVYQHARFGADVLDVITLFLRNNPQEIILMRVKEEHDPEGNT